MELVVPGEELIIEIRPSITEADRTSIAARHPPPEFELHGSASGGTMLAMRSLDTSKLAASVQLEVYRRMTPSQRLRAGLELTALSRRLLTSGIRRRHPEYTGEELRLAMIRTWLGPDTFRMAFPGAPELDP